MSTLASSLRPLFSPRTLPPPLKSFLSPSPSLPPRPLLLSSLSPSRLLLKPTTAHLQDQSPSAAAADPSLPLPPKLREIVALFQSVSDSRAKYQQLLHYGTRLPPLDPRFKTEPNRVRGCVSRVWVRAFRDPDEAAAVRFEADSDSALTKGLAALLVFGLSGSPALDIARVPPEFIDLLGLRQSLSPSRNSGLLNMLKLMQQKALQLDTEIADLGDIGVSGLGAPDSGSNPILGTKSDGITDSLVADEVPSANGYHSLKGDPEVHSADFDSRSGGRKDRIRKKLEEGLSPMELVVEDTSHLHARHAGVAGRNGETHFNVRVVSKEFEGKSLLKRHRLVYDLLQEELNTGLHALAIDAKSPSEV